MRVESYKENEDGSGTVTLNLTEDEIKHLIQYAVINMLDKFVKEKKEKKGHECSGSCSNGGECKGDHSGGCSGDCDGSCDGNCNNGC